MKAVIRADASSYIGYGHIMRCLTLAKELKKEGVNVNFLCREDEGNLIHSIENNNFNVFSLPGDINAGKDAELTAQIIADKTGNPDFLIVDHYCLDISWEEFIRPYTGRIMVIDDFINRRHDCDIILNQNFGIKAQMYDNLTPQNCRKLTGSSYILLRNQFREIRKRIKPHSGKISKIFIFLGGADPTNETEKVIEAVKLIKNHEISYIVLVGDSNSHRKEIESICASMPDITFCRQIYDVAGLMAETDFAIGAGGSNTWERCCLGLPSMMIIAAENQRILVENLAEEGIIVNAGWYEDVTASTIASMADEIIADKNKLKDMSRKAMEIVDGEGVSRVVREMLN
jgi:UDP-2,4-diacetamido-2,4,6-trideoxy-beta-L-altropyranose hydrolase